MKIEGIFAIDKPLGITSQRAVQIVKYWAKRKTGNKKIKVGHAGTLDPLASGILVLGVGREYTKRLDDIVNDEKEYVANMMLGEVSATDDAEGEKTVVNKNIQPTKLEIEKILKEFEGTIKQVPSAYSAIKIEGEEAYKRVRRGEDVEMKERTVQINKVELVDYKYPILSIKVECGKGTYIRTLARDIGDKLKTGAYLTSLRRTRVGKFTIADTVDMNKFNMNIAVHASELDADRVDGTRVYIKELLDRFGDIAKEDVFCVYHKGNFNDVLKPKKYENYIFKKLRHIPIWTQTVFALNIFWKRPDVVWMPLHNLCRIRSKKTKTVVTIHDLAFKFFPDTFVQKDLKKLNMQTDYAVKNADRIIAISKATKNDILKFYPNIERDKITVIHHGIDKSKWQKQYEENAIKSVLNKYNLQSKKFLIHVGAIQPRKDIKTIVKAFDIVKQKNESLKLVLVGGDGWKSKEIHDYAKKSEYYSDIIFTGNISFDDVKILMQNAKIFVFASLYEGFGLPVLEACAVGLPIVSSRNSSIPEILGDGALYFENQNYAQCAQNIEKILYDDELCEQMQQRSISRVGKFSWDKSAKRTLQVLRK